MSGIMSVRQGTYAPEGTRTPNLLIRSQMGAVFGAHDSAASEGDACSVPAIRIPKADKHSPNNPHNAPLWCVPGCPVCDGDNYFASNQVGRSLPRSKGEM